jgi:hypothetical protein
LARLSQLAQDFPEILELDLNPFMAFPESDRCRAVDARLRISLEPERTRFVESKKKSKNSKARAVKNS